MKVASGQVATVLHDPSRWAGILLYGEDGGLVRDRVAMATRAVLGSASDPFRLTVLTREEHGRLPGEVTGIALGGGRRVIRVQDAVDGLAGTLGKLGDHRADALVILEAGLLTPRSKLRTAIEAHPHWAAIACYPERESAVASEITRVMRDAGLGLTPDALAYLSAELAGDTARRRRELEKLVLHGSDGGVVSLADAQACCTTNLDASVGMAVSTAFSGEAASCDALVEELIREGVTGPGFLAVLSNELHRLLKVRVSMDSGQPVEDAARRLQPPVYPSQMASFMQEVRRWTAKDLAVLGQAVHDADIACKRASSPDSAIAARLLATVANWRTMPH